MLYRVRIFKKLLVSFTGEVDADDIKSYDPDPSAFGVEDTETMVMWSIPMEQWLALTPAQQAAADILTEFDGYDVTEDRMEYCLEDLRSSYPNVPMEALEIVYAVLQGDMSRDFMTSKEG